MADFFFSKLPQGHAIRSISKSAATNSIRAEALVVAAPDGTVDGLRRQCAAVVWVSSDVYSVDAIEKLKPPERAFLLSLFGLQAGGTSKAQARRIDEHIRRTRHGIDAQPSVIDGGGLGDQGRSGGGASGIGLSGLAGTLLLPAQCATLAALSRSDMLELLRAAGMPADASDSTDTLRGKCATAAWAGERLRSSDDVTALPAPVPSLVIEAFGIPSSWKAEARDRALEGVLRACRDSPWVVNPSSSHGLINAERSAIFRVAEGLQARTRMPAPSLTSSQYLSAAEQAQLASVLALTGNDLSDIECVDGRWQLRESDSTGGSGGAGSAAAFQPRVHADTTAQAALEKQVRTLRVETYSLLTAEERKDQANRSKAMPGRKRAAAYPGDTEVDDAELSFNPFAEWPHEQSLKCEASYSYSLCGRILRNALRWCNRNFTDALAQLTLSKHQGVTTELYESFSEAVSSQRHDQALLLASQAISEATTQMTAILANAKSNAAQFPDSKLLQHIASRREVQALELKVFLGDMAQRITDATKLKDRAGATALATAAYIDFMNGWLSLSDKSLVSADSLVLASAPALATMPAIATTQWQATMSAAAAAAAPSGVTGGAPGPAGPANKAARTRSGGQGPAASAGFATPLGRVPVRGICSFMVHIPCSAEIVGDTLGVRGAPPCKKCGKGNHFFGECPTEWGRVRRPLPGFLDDGSRIPKAWNKNEPIQQIVTAWVKFLQDKSNFNGKFPEVAGVPNAPSLADFQARVAGAPVKP